jgi:hypothetical protein
MFNVLLCKIVVQSLFDISLLRYACVHVVFPAYIWCGGGELIFLFVIFILCFVTSDDSL